jgi:acyl-coenzyme A synthetase/AMP-(fatty) acid ligase
MPTDARTAVSVSHPAEAGWVDEVLLAGPDTDVALVLDGPVLRGALRTLVADRQRQLAAAGLRGGGTVALNLPPSLAYVAELLAAWRIGAQVMLLDHRLTAYEVQGALARLDPQLVVRPAGDAGQGGLRTFTDVTPEIVARGGRPAGTRHILLQLSSGSTGPSKVIGRTSVSLVDELARYTAIPGSPQRGERIVLLASMVHVLGLVGGLLFGLHTGCPLVLPARLTVDSVFAAIAADDTPATVLGVPFHTELLASVATPPRLPALKRMTTGGELVRPAVHDAFTARYGVPLGNMYGMTEVGVIATDLFGEHRPALTPAPGLSVTQSPAGELLIGLPASPYVGDVDPGRFADGLLRTRDAGTVDPATGLVTVQGRNDSQISIGGLKVDLTEVEQVLATLPGVRAAVVTHHHGIEAYVETDPDTGVGLEDAAAPRLAPYKRPRTVHVLDRLPRTTTGKLVRDRAVLRAAADVKERETHA